MIRKTIVILANSIKHHQHCVAGKCVVTRQWIRPVSTSNGAALSYEQTKYSNSYGVFPVKPKQKVEIALESHVPLLNQPENHLISDQRWQQRFCIEDNELAGLIDSPETLWGEGDRVLYSDILNHHISIDQSLYLVRVLNLSLYLTDRNKRRAQFCYNGIEYDFAATDPNFDAIMSGRNVEGVLCISLGEEYQGSCFKLIATIF